MIKDFLKPWLLPILLIGLVFLLGAIGYRVTEGWDWSDCLWMVLITITTIGFGEVEPLSEAGRIITLLIIGGGVVVIQLTLQRFVALRESGYFFRMKALRFRRMLRRMENHVIICGYGRIGQEIANQLLSDSIPTLIVEIDSLSKDKAEKNGLVVLQADATLDETLLSAGISNCRSLVVVLPTDASNLYVLLSAKGINPNCRIIVRAESEEASSKLKLAGASVVISPYVAAGKSMAKAAI